MEDVLRTLVDRGGRAHQETVASAAGLPYVGIGQGLAVVKRILNVEGYESFPLTATARPCGSTSTC